MTLRKKSVLVAVVQVLVVTSLGVKLVADRVTRPRVWVKAAPADPNLPIRGRYVSLSLYVEATRDLLPSYIALAVENGRLTAVPTNRSTRLLLVHGVGGVGFMLASPIAFFIPEHVDDPSIRPPGEELWVEVTVPRRGPPRPIRLGVKKDGVLTPLDLR